MTPCTCRADRLYSFDNIIFSIILDLDVSASLSAVLCMVSVLLGFITGGYGLFSNYTCIGAFKIASCLSLIAGWFSLS